MQIDKNYGYLVRKSLLLLLLFTLIISPLYAGGSRWTSKPPIGSIIDWGHPLSKGLVGCWLMNENGGSKIKDLSSNNDATTNSIWGSNKKGVVNITNGTSTTITIPDKNNIDFNYNQNFSIICSYEDILTNNSDGAIVEKWSGSGAYPYVIRYRDTQIRFARYDGTNNPQINANITTKGLYNVLCFVKNNSTLLSYLNGKFALSALDTTNTTSTNTSPLYLGSRGASLNWFKGKYSFLYIYNRALSPSEILQLYQEPYCFIKPPTVWSMFSTAVAAVRRFFIFD